jgi:glycosyltransferase 2 family protein
MRKMHIPKKVTRVWRFGLPVIIFLVIVFFLARDWRSEWQELMTKQLQFNPWLLGCAFLGFLLQELSYGLIWRFVLRRLGYNLSLRVCLRIYLSSEFVRYIPGNVLHVITRIMWVSKCGVSRSEAFASMIIELVTKIVAGALVFALSIIFWGNIGVVNSLVHGQRLFIFVGVVGVVVMLICVHPKVLNGILSLALRMLKKDSISLKMRYRDILWVLLAWCASWVVAGCAFFFLLWSIWPAAPLALLPVCVGLYALAWDVGFASFITPSGLGIREVVIAAVFGLVFPLPTGLAGIIAILSRLISTVAELLCVGVAYLLQYPKLQYPKSGS